MFLLLYVCVASGLVVSSPVDKPHYNVEQAEQLFEEFILDHDKIYSSQEEKQTRLGIFTETLKTINDLNSIGVTEFGINHFADLTREEVNRYMGFVPTTVDDISLCEMITDKDITTVDAPDSLDWVSKGAVTVIKDQGPCGSCWAFSTIGNIEGQYFTMSKQLQSFSEQEVMDCSASNDGCEGGDMIKAMLDLKELGGVELEWQDG